MTTIWKFTCRVEDEQIVEMPKEAEILHVASQFGHADSFEIWARVESTYPLVGRKIIVHGTGHPASRDERHIGTLIVANGALVWHVFDGGEA